MVAAPNSSRRRGGRWGSQRLGTALAAVCLGLELSSFFAHGGPASATELGTTAPPVTALISEKGSASTKPAAVTVSIAPITPTITPGTPVTVDLEVRNTSTADLPAGRLGVFQSDSWLTNISTLNTWLTSDPAVGASRNTLLTEIDSRPLPIGQVAHYTVTLAGNALAPFRGAQIIGLGAEVTVAGTIVTTDRAVFPASSSAPISNPVPLALASPITVPGVTGGLLSVPELSALTAPRGTLTQQLDAVDNQPITVGIDPRIIASIRQLGTEAPASATAWLARLGAMNNEVFPLGYGDADLAIQAQLGLPALLAPTSFAGASTSTPGTITPATPTPSEPPNTGTTTQDVLAWRYNRTDLAWPGDNTVASGNIQYLASAELRTTILAPHNVAPSDSRGAVAVIDEGTALVADDRVTAAFRAALDASTDVEWRAAIGRLMAEVTLLARGAQPAPTLLATAARSSDRGPGRLRETLEVLATNSSVRPTTLTHALTTPPVPRTLVTMPESNERRNTVTALVGADSAIQQFASIVPQPELISAPARRDLLALLGVSATVSGPRSATVNTGATPPGSTDEWNQATTAWLAAQHAVLQQVSIVSSSQINVVSSKTGVPTTILNQLPYPVTVEVNVVPSNGRLRVEDTVKSVVEAFSRSTVRVPVAAGVGNGDVMLTVLLKSATGTQIGNAVQLKANVQADWEGVGVGIVAVAALAFFALGMWRSIKRRRARAVRT